MTKPIPTETLAEAIDGLVSSCRLYLKRCERDGAPPDLDVKASIEMLDARPAERLTDPLAAAVDALGAIMSALNARRLLRDRVGQREPSVIDTKLAEAALTDDQLEELAASGFEAGTIALAAAGHPGAVVHSCDGGLGSAEAEEFLRHEASRKPS